MIRRQAGVEANTLPIIPGADTSTLAADGATATDSILADPAATTVPGAAGASDWAAGDPAAISSAALAGLIPPEILSAPAVQKAISKVAVQQGYDPDVLMNSASSILSSASDGASASASATGVSNVDALAGTETDAGSATETDTEAVTRTTSPSDDEASSTPLSGSSTRIGASPSSSSTNSSSFNSTETANDSSFAMRGVNPQYGWVAALAMAAGWVALEGGM